MLSNIWGGVRGAISKALRFWNSRSVVQRCRRPFRLGTCTVNVNGLFIMRLAILAGSEGQRLASPSVCQSFMNGSDGGSHWRKRECSVTASMVEGNG
jgi:fluoride ion exporter CrcB/FEX